MPFVHSTQNKSYIAFSPFSRMNAQVPQSSPSRLFITQNKICTVFFFSFPRQQLQKMYLTPSIPARPKSSHLSPTRFHHSCSSQEQQRALNINQKKVTQVNWFNGSFETSSELEFQLLLKKKNFRLSKEEEGLCSSFNLKKGIN